MTKPVLRSIRKNAPILKAITFDEGITLYYEDLKMENWEKEYEQQSS